MHIQRKETSQFYINFPTPIAQAMDLAKGETVEWTLHDKGHLIVSRREVPPEPVPVKKSRVERSLRFAARRPRAGFRFAGGFYPRAHPMAGRLA